MAKKEAVKEEQILAEETEQGVAEQEVAEQEVAAEQEEMVTVELPLDDGRYKDDVHVIVNGKETVVHRGEPVKVPKYVADVLRDSQRQDAMFTRYSRALQDDFQSSLEQL